MDDSITLYKFGYEFQQHLAENKYDQYILHVIGPGGMTQISFRVEVEQSKLSLIAEDMNDITTIIELFDYFAACTEPNGKTAEIWLTPPPDNDEDEDDEEDDED